MSQSQQQPGPGGSMIQGGIMKAGDYMQRLQQLHQRPRHTDWASQTQNLVLQLWDHLGREQDTPEFLVNGLVEFVHDHDCFAVARLVISALRSDSHEAGQFSPPQQQVLRGLRDEIQQHRDGDRPKITYHADPYFVEEKRVYWQIMKDRLAILFTEEWTLNEKQKQDLDAWLDKIPASLTGESETTLGPGDSDAGPSLQSSTAAT